MTDRSLGETPFNVGCVESPLQALNLVEYCRATGTQIDLLIVDDNVESAGQNLRQIRKVLDPESIEVGLVGDRRGTYRSPLKLARQVRRVEALLPPDGPVRFIGGEYRSNLLWAVIQRQRDRVAEVVFVDDGTAMLRIRRGDQGEEHGRLERSRRRVFAVCGLDSSPSLPVTFFTAYGKELQLSASDSVIENDYAYTRGRLLQFEAGEAVTYIVGNAFAEAGVVADTQTAAELAVALVGAAQELSPDSTLVYVAHRREGESTLAALTGLCEVARFDVPFELIPVETGVAPGRVVGYYSSVFNNLAHIYGDTVALDVIEVPIDDVLPSWREFVTSVHETYRSNPRIQVRPAPEVDRA